MNASRDHRAPMSRHHQLCLDRCRGSDSGRGVPDTGGPTEGARPGTPQEYAEPDYQLLQSASVDLDDDGVNEQILVVRAVVPDETGTSDRVEGRLLISNGTEKGR